MGDTILDQSVVGREKVNSTDPCNRHHVEHEYLENKQGWGPLEPDFSITV